MHLTSVIHHGSNGVHSKGAPAAIGLENQFSRCLSRGRKQETALCLAAYHTAEDSDFRFTHHGLGAKITGTAKRDLNVVIKPAALQSRDLDYSVLIQ